MNQGSRMTFVLGALAFLVFAFGLVQLFAIRFSAGDVYPAYSSLRADPLGSRALYESLDAVEGVRVGRLYEPLGRLGDPSGTTLLWIGDRQDERPRDGWREFVLGGGRLVLGWLPSAYSPQGATNAPGRFPWQQNPAPRRPLVPEQRLSEDPRDVTFRSEWGVEIDYLPLAASDTNVNTGVALRVADLDLPEEMSWHTSVCLTNLGPEWRVVYERDSRPVVVERAFGDGSVVITTDSYSFSNEALRSERQTPFLLWSIGENDRVVFDETHLGVESSRGIAQLMRHYRMHGLAGGALVFAGLFLWRSLTTFLPRWSDRGRDDDGAIAGRDLAAGFVRLLQRGIKKKEILNTCFEEWKEGQQNNRSCSSERLTRMEQVMMSLEESPKSDRDLVSAYRDLHTTWKQNDFQKES